MFMLSKEKGDIAMGKAISHFLANGYEVCLPVGDKRDYDLVIEKDGKLGRVQVKYAGLYLGKQKCTVALRVMGGNQSFYSAKRYRDDAFDYLFVHSAKGDSFLLPWQEPHTSKSTLSIDAAIYSMYKV